MRPVTGELNRYNYIRYPNGKEHVYDLISYPGETEGLHETAPLKELRQTLIDNTLDLGLDLRGFEKPERGVNAMASLDGSVILAGGNADNNYWAYGENAEKIHEEDGGTDTLWYMGGPDDYVLHAPAYLTSETFVSRPLCRAVRMIQANPKKWRLSHIRIRRLISKLWNESLLTFKEVVGLT